MGAGNISAVANDLAEQLAAVWRCNKDKL